VKVTGTIGSDPFIGTDYIRVIRAVVSAPPAGSHLVAGSVTQVRWQTPSGVTVQSVALVYSLDGGSTWSPIARGQPNTGSYDWSVPNVGTDQARVAVVLVGPANDLADRSAPEDLNGLEVSGVLGVSDPFVITSPLAVSEPRLELGLQGSVPNPSRNPSVSFTVPDTKPARLVVYDVSGRVVSRREVGSLGAGRHVVPVGAPGTLAPGIYLVHLIQGDRRLVARAVVVR